MDFKDEIKVGRYTYGVSATSDTGAEEERSRVALEFTGARADDGQVVAEGNLLVGEDALADSGLFLARVLDVMAAFHGHSSRGSRAGQRPPNAGQPWTTELDATVRTRWLQASSDATGSALLGDLGRELGRSRSSLRARLAKLGCDPDVPGRVLNGGDEP